MPKSFIKKLIPGTVVAVFVILQLPVVAHAATEEEITTTTDKAVDYLADNQNDDGSIAGFGGETEWSVVAVATKGEDPDELENGSGNSTVDFLEGDLLAANAPATDVERKIIAIAAAGEDTEDFGGVDYNAQLASHHNNDQIGEMNLLNDDIFGVIAIDTANDDNLRDMAQDGLDYFLAHQKPDGGFSWTTNDCAFCGADSNDTAAAIVAMYAADNMQLTNASLLESKDKAVVFLLSTRNDDGGFGYDAASPSDSSSTSWALMALNVIGESVLNQAMTARDWLLANQNPDGGFSYGAYGINLSDTYTTAHAIIALQGTTWLLDPSPIVGSTTSPTSTPEKGNSNSQTKPESESSDNVASSPQGSVLSATTSNGSQSENKNNPSGSIGRGAASTELTESGNGLNYSLYGLTILGLIAVGWFVIQSRQKQGI